MSSPVGPSSGGGGTKKAGSPLPYIRQAYVEWLRSLREPKSIRRISVALIVALAVILVAAARTTGGAVKLLLAVGVFTAVIASFVAIGALIAQPREKSAVEAYVIWKVSFFLFLIGGYALPNILAYIGLTSEQSFRMLMGFGSGIAVVIVTHWLWYALGSRFPQYVYRPPDLRRWCLRISMVAGGMVGGVIAVTSPADLGSVLGVFADLVKDLWA